MYSFICGTRKSALLKKKKGLQQNGKMMWMSIMKMISFYICYSHLGKSKGNKHTIVWTAWAKTTETVTKTKHNTVPETH